MKELLHSTITELAKLYRTRQVSPVEVITFLFDQIDEKEPKLNAFITLLKTNALQEAETAEKQFLHGEPAHLLTGIPYSLKDLVYTKNIRTTCGSTILSDFLPDYNATVYEKLRKTGAILIGKTNMLEFAYGIAHPEVGQTNNPWDPSKTAGGSSGGSAAAVASGLGHFSIGSDTGGSIRIPASYCGVAGLKPTYGAVSLHGVVPLSWSLDHLGPITRTAEDAGIVFQAITGCDEQDPYTKKQSIDHSNGQSSKNKIGLLPDACLDSLEEDVRKVYNHSLKILEDMGWNFVQINFPNWHMTEEILMKVLLPEAAYIHTAWLQRKQDYAPLTYKQIELGLQQKTIDYLAGLEQQKEFKKEMSAILADVDCLFMPTVAFTAPAEDPAIGDEEKNEMRFTGPFNLSGHPALTVNLGFSSNGLPIGMQFVGSYFAEGKLLQIAGTVEKQVHKDMR